MNHDHATNQELIKRLEKKDRLFRTFQTISVVFLGLGIAILLFLSYNQQTQNHKLLLNGSESLKEQKQIIDKQQQTIDTLSDKITDLQKHVDCLFDLATQPNPQAAHISNASTCQITDTNPVISRGYPKSNQALTSSNNATPQAQATEASPSSSPAPPANPQPNQSFLQKKVIQPIMSLINKAL